ncbi:unnamed protein product, partial [Mesorhabditis spiculigera]
MRCCCTKADRLHLRVAFYIFFLFHFVGKVAWYGRADLQFYELLEKHDRTREGLRVNVTIYVAINFLTAADMLLFLTATTLAIIGLQRGIKVLSLGYPAYMGMEIKVWYGNIEDSLVDRDSVNAIIAAYLLITSLLAFSSYIPHYRQMFPKKERSPTIASTYFSGRSRHSSTVSLGFYVV